MKLAAAIAAAVVLASCSSGAPGGGFGGESPPPASAAQAPGAELPSGDAPSSTKGPVIATVETREARVAIVGGGADLRVVVRKVDGALVADGLTLAELRERDPFLSVVVESAVAGGGGGGSYIDATNRKRDAEPKPKALMMLLDL
jgi:hypothetical protein